MNRVAVRRVWQVMSLRSALGRISIGLLALAALPAVAQAAPAVTGEFAVSGIESSNKVVEGPDGEMWVTLSGGVHDVARIDPFTGAVEERNIGPLNGPLSGPAGIASVKGEIWVTAAGNVTHFSPSDPPTAHETIPMPAFVGSYPIAAGPDGNLWVATSEALLRFPPAGGSAVLGGLKEFAVPGLGPRDIDAAGPLLAIADFGGSRLLTATTEGVTAEYKLAGGPQGVAGGPDGQIAYSQPSAEPKEVGLLTPPGAPTGQKVPGTDAFGAALGPDGAYWFAEGNRDELIRLTRTGQVSELTGFAPGSRPRQIAAGPNNTLWVTLEGSNEVARVSGVVRPPEEPPVKPPEEPPVKPPHILVIQPQISQGPKGAVKTTRRRAFVRFRFSASVPGAGFECRVREAVVNKAASSPASTFAPCRSPKSYRLRPGRYRFEVRAVFGPEVRAVFGDVSDPTPAARSFRVVRARPHR